MVCGRYRREQWFAGDIAGDIGLREVSPETKVCGRYRRGQWFAGDIAGDNGLRGDIAGNDYLRGEIAGTIIFKVYGNFTRPYLRLFLIACAPGSWGKRHGKRFSSPKPPTLSAGAAQIGGARVILDLGGEGLRRRMCEAFFLRLRITP